MIIGVISENLRGFSAGIILPVFHRSLIRTSMTTRTSEHQLWLTSQEGTPNKMWVAEVAIPGRRRTARHYAVPDKLRKQLRFGGKVRIQKARGNGDLEGLCVALSQREWDQTLPMLIDADPAPPLLDASLVELGVWIANHYFCSLHGALAAMAPVDARQPAPRLTTVLTLDVDKADEEQFTAKQTALVEVLRQGTQPRTAALSEASVSSAVLQNLIRRGVVSATEQAVSEPSLSDAASISEPPHVAEDDFTLTEAQVSAVQAIEAATNERALRVLLLFGVPGSGKTEVYVRAIRKVNAADQQAIIVVPEIALATQLVDRLAKRFRRAVVLHSGLTNKARSQALWAIKRGECDVVIGTRSAVFAPCPNLGLIVVDEEQESSLKNLAAPFFHARDVAIKRAQLLQIPVLLGSATPALETWHNSETLPHYQRLELNERVPGAELPQADAVAQSSRDVVEGRGLLSSRLAHELQRVLDDGAQAIILHNRRGYAPALRCERCGQTLRCPRCDASLVFHRGEANQQPRLKCHQCGYATTDLPRECPDHSCGGTLRQSGSAIQRLADEIIRRYPNARLLRLDSDTMKRRTDYVAALESFEARSADIMIGTQMVAKGLDFPGVRLVGVIDADAGLSIPDFRAGERVFQLLMQVVGRAGRQAGASLALLQADNPDAPAVRYALAMDYRRFAAHELRARERYRQPPFTRLLRLVLADERPGRARQAASELAASLARLAPEVHPALRVEPSEACVIPRLREMLRYQVLVHGPREGGLHKLLERAEAEKCLWPAVRRFTIDIEPLDLL